MDLFQLEVFLTVAREGSFSRAAEKLYRTQPAISQAVRKLERELDEPLFDRSSRDGTLTDAGRVLQDYSEKLLNLRKDAHQALKELRELYKGKLSIAANEYTCQYLLPVLGEFRKHYPLVKVTVLRSLASRIPSDLLNHNVELGVLSFDPDEPALKSIVVYNDELALVAHPQHPLAAAGQVTIQQLGAESFVAHNV
ncbi:MAG TPA: LysR family transcriptional regulator, partial [Blastocatellia bacterium]